MGRNDLAVYLALGSCWLSCWTLTQTTAAAEFDELLRRVPDSANAIIALDVTSILDSPLAESEGWRERYSDNYSAMPLILPPSAKRFLLGVELDVESMEPKLEVASMELATAPTAKDVVLQTGGILDSLSGTDVVWPKRGTCVAKFSNTEFGVLSPASRQTAGRWIDQSIAKQKGNLFSSYLRQAVHFASGAGPEIIMAVDLAHILRPAEIRAAVKRSEILRALDETEATSLLSSLRGVTLGVRVSDRIYGKLIVDFAKDASMLKSVEKPLIIHALANFGASLDEFDDWEAKNSGKRISIEGPLTSDGMRRMFSLVNLDAAIVNRKDVARDGAPATPEQTKNEVERASRRYFQTVQKYLTDIQRSSRKKNSFSSKALWVSTYARKIEKLSTQNVDPDLVSYGERVVYLMRDAVAHAHGTAQQAAIRMSKVRPKSEIRVGALPTANVNNYGGTRIREYAPMTFANVDVASAIAERESIAREEHEKGSQAAQQIISQIKSETDSIREVMTSRYGGTF